MTTPIARPEARVRLKPDATYAYVVSGFSRTVVVSGFSRTVVVSGFSRTVVVSGFSRTVVVSGFSRTVVVSGFSGLLLSDKIRDFDTQDRNPWQSACALSGQFRSGAAARTWNALRDRRHQNVWRSPR